MLPTTPVPLRRFAGSAHSAKSAAADVPLRDGFSVSVAVVREFADWCADLVALGRRAIEASLELIYTDPDGPEDLDRLEELADTGFAETADIFDLTDSLMRAALVVHQISDVEFDRFREHRKALEELRRRFDAEWPRANPAVSRQAKAEAAAGDVVTTEDLLHELQGQRPADHP